MAAHAHVARRVVAGVRPADTVLPLLTAIVGTLEIASAHDQGWLVGVGCLIASCAALALARVVPLAVPPLVGVLYLVVALAGFDVSVPASWLVPPLLAAFLVGLHAPRERRVAGLCSVAGMLAVTYGTLALATDFDPNPVFGLVGSLGPWALGVGLRTARERAVAAGAALERERLEGVSAVERAAAAERGRIAGELHDVLAHTIGEMVVRTAVADDELARDPSAASGTLGAVARTGRAALGETGRLLRLLRDDADEMGLGVQPLPDGVPASNVVARRRGRRLWLTAADVALPLAFALAGVTEIALDPVLTPRWLWLTGCVVAAVELLGRRRRPAATVIVVAVILGLPMAISGAPDDPASWILGFGLACFAAGRRTDQTRRGLVAVAMAWAIILGLGELGRATSADDAIVTAVLAFVPWLAGVAQRRALERARAAGVEQERERARAAQQVEAAAAAERRRIALELHDVLASSLSVMIVQASLAEDVCVRDPAAARLAMASVEQSGRRALEELGQLLRLSGDALPESGIGPRRGIADIFTLAEEFGRAGLRVAVDLPARPEALPAGVELSSYRIVQEALTNVLKHAPGSGAAVRLSCDGTAIAIEVSNGPPTSDALGVESGHGLVGLRERVSHHGGDLRAGPTSDGGFVLTATLPGTLEAA